MRSCFPYPACCPQLLKSYSSTEARVNSPSDMAVCIAVMNSSSSASRYVLFSNATTSYGTEFIGSKGW